MNESARITNVKNTSSLRDFERFLHEAGWSKREAALLASGGWKNMAMDSPEALLLDGLRELNGR